MLSYDVQGGQRKEANDEVQQEKLSVEERKQRRNVVRFEIIWLRFGINLKEMSKKFQKKIERGFELK